MHNLRMTFIGLMVAWTTTALTQPPNELQDKLLAEPLWLLFDGDGPPRPVWFESERGSLRIATCADMPGCKWAASTSGQELRVQGFEGAIPVWPAPANGSLAIVPAWVVPASSARMGH